MTACQQIRVGRRAVVVDCFSDPELRRIRCCTVLLRNEVMPFNCGLSHGRPQEGKTGISPLWKLGLRTTDFYKKRSHELNSF